MSGPNIADSGSLDCTPKRYAMGSICEVRLLVRFRRRSAPRLRDRIREIDRIDKYSRYRNDSELAL